MNNKLVVEVLIKWGKHNTDVFPWRSPESPYEIILAEIMLIRTATEQVEPVYLNFIDKYPNVYKLHQSNKTEVLEMIENLGLRWRAERLKQFADYVVTELDGSFPDNQNKLMDIPGVGPYVAASTLTFHFKKRAIMIDSNTVRFFKRYSGIIFDGEGRRSSDLKSRMDNLVPDHDTKAAKFNESFLDFMRKICRAPPEKPSCSTCKLNVDCTYYSEEDRKN